MSIADTIAPKSDQLNYEDFALSGPKTLTVREVRITRGDQPASIFFEGVDRPFKPAKTVRRLLVKAWGPNEQQYVGRSMTLFGDPHVTWGGEEVGGIRISHLSHIDKPIKEKLAVSQKKRSVFTIQPLKAPTPPPIAVSDEQIAAATTVEELRSLWAGADEIQQQAIKQRVSEIEGGQA